MVQMIRLILLCGNKVDIDSHQAARVIRKPNRRFLNRFTSRSRGKRFI